MSADRVEGVVDPPAIATLAGRARLPDLRRPGPALAGLLNQRRYGYALALVLSATALVSRDLLIPVLGTHTPFILLFPTVLVVAWWAGWGPALAAITVCAIGSLLLLIEPRFGVGAVSPSDLLNVALATLVMLVIASVTVRLRDSRALAERRLLREQSLIAQQRRMIGVRDAFANMLGHELRTPITVILGEAHRLSKLSTSLPTPVAEAAADIEAEAERLHHLAEDMLVLNRGDAGPDLLREPVLVQHVIARVVADVVRRFGSVIDTDIEPGIPVVLADSTYLEQILRNLLTNAAKYGRSGSQIAIRAYMTGDGVVISVANIGDPVAVGDEERIFELFYRAPDTSGAAPGAGVGLFVTRSLATAMGGRVWAERRSDGMTFHLVLEVAPGI